MSFAIISQPIPLQKQHPQPIEFDGRPTLVVSDDDDDFCTQSIWSQRVAPPATFGGKL